MAGETVQAAFVGSAPDSRDGAALRAAAQIWNANDALLWQIVQGIVAGIDPDRNSLKKLADLIAALNTDPELSAIMALNSAADRLIYFTGPGTAALAPLTAFARGLIAAADGPTALAAIGAAGLASPEFSGAPKVPTAAPGTNSTQAANTAFVVAAISAAVTALVNGSPAALDQLNELAAALGNDPNFATTIINLLAAKAPLASPNLTGAPSAPTAPPGTNTTQLATTAFIAAAIAALGTAATKNVGTAAGNVVQLDAGARLPAVDASQLINVPGTSGAAVTVDDFRTLAIQLAKLKGSTVGMAGGVADDFKDQTGYDTANSVNGIYDATNNLVTNVSTPTAEELAAMTSNSAPAGQTALASTEINSSYQAYMAYDGAGGTWWASNAKPAGSYVQRTTSATRREASYALTAPSTSANEMPTAWTRWGSNDGGTTRTTIDTQTGITWSNSQRRVFTVPVANRGDFKTYGITPTANGGGTNYSIAAIESIPVGTQGALDLLSTAFAAQAVPTKGSIFVLVKATADTITANTNLLAKLSRDGGTTYTTATLTSTGAFGGYTVYEANGFDLSGQPSGSSIKWRLQTVGTALAVQVDAVVAQWG